MSILTEGEAHSSADGPGILPRRKGMGSLVVERAESLRVGGVALNLHANGWRALEELGVADDLRRTATLITSSRIVRRRHNQTSVSSARKENRCLRRKDVVEALAKNVTAGTIRYGCQVVAIHQDPATNGALLTTADGKTIKAKVVVGCDGWNSVVVRHVGLAAPSQYARFIVLGFASYPEGHPFGPEFMQVIRDDFTVGVVPVDGNLVHFFASRAARGDTCAGAGADDVKSEEAAARAYVLEKVEEFPAGGEVAEMVSRRRFDPATSWTLTKVWYRPPWQVALGRFRRGAVTVAGDAMHAMGPFIGQGGAAALEDAVVLARSLSSRAAWLGGGDHKQQPHDDDDDDVGAAIDGYVAERRLRLTKLSLHSFAIGTLLTTRSLVVKLLCVAVQALLGGDSRPDENYDCGRL
ncbi:monooxygenase 1-like [Oryza brachyantha]|uniref:monooxygenase 1-like n=1 Tax=Oryza brachyantha TaxID=4533 RepID=UPI001ADBBB62|nr:monooxygenase 1-like [Oryza brachyantha]